jgi:lysophospholipase L1-like esterase
VPIIPANTTFITLFIGYNDELSLAAQGATTITGDPSQVEATFAANMQLIVAELQKTGSTIYVARLPNAANLPGWRSADMLVRSTLSSTTAAMNSTIDHLGLRVVDLLCAPGMYDDANYTQTVGGVSYVYGIHPNTLGHAYIASIFLQTIQNNLAASPSCSYSQPL